MSIQHLSLVAFGFTFACASSDPTPDAATPIDPAGRYDVHSTYSLAAPPVSAATALGELAAATDGADDPSRYLVDLVIARLPEDTQRIAKVVAPYLAAYLNERIASVAPHFLDGMHALSDGLQRIARRFGTHEDFRIDGEGHVQRTLIGYDFDGVSVELLGDVGGSTTVAVAGDKLTISPHSISIAYGQLVRLGFDRAVIPSVDPTASDLGDALRDLVDCTRLGELFANWIGFGSSSLYAQACEIGLTAAAAKIYDAMPDQTATLEASGIARATDPDRDGAMDAIENGSWIGTFDQAPLGLAIFDGKRVAP